MRRRSWLVALVLVTVTFAAPTVAQRRTAAPDLSAIDPVVTAMMSEWHVPGLALGVIKDGQLLYAKGYGYRDLEQKLPVTPRTLMAIGSNSKSFTTVLLGMLVDQKKLDWDTPVLTYLPDFKLYDDYATRHMTPRDLVSHRSGLPRHDLLWYGRHFSRKELYQRLRYLEPSASFRAIWQYQNLMFMTAGYLEEQLTGRSWDDLVQDWIFTPLGMSRSLTSVKEMTSGDDFAYAYGWRDSTVVRIPYRNIDPVGPAGSINSSVEDMLKYVQFRLDLGQGGGRQLLSKGQALEMQRPQMVIGAAADALWGGFDAIDYGLGVATGVYRGHHAVIHGGGIDGFISQMSWLPDDRIGVVVLSNQGTDNPIPTLVAKAVYDRVLGLSPIDWAARQREQDRANAERALAQRQRLAADRKPETSPSHPLGDYVGTYGNPGYGSLEVRLVDGGLEIRLDDLSAKLEHYHYDVFQLTGSGSGPDLSGLAEFSTNTKGEIDRIAVPLEPSVAPIVFKR